jgi:NADPH:quinone reductase-like Zn-dependent oxidoreductase
MRGEAREETTMRAITVDEYGAAPELAELPDPKPEPRQVLIKVEAAGINPMDRAIAAGAWKDQMPGSFPFVLGSDLAGVVEAVGEGEGRFQPGEEVFGQLLIAPLGSAGTYAEYVAVTEDAPLERLPQGLDPTTAAALPTAGVTALQIVDAIGPLPGKTVLIVGAAGGVGSFAMQLAAQAGAHVIAVARADDAARMRAYGAAETVDHTAVSVPDAVQQAHPDGIDVLVDLASDANGFATLAALVHRGGTALTTRYSADSDALASRGVTGVNFRVEMSGEALARLADLVVTQAIVVPPITVIKLDDVPTLNTDTHTGGKTVITP